MGTMRCCSSPMKAFSRLSLSTSALAAPRSKVARQAEKSAPSSGSSQ
jgi:hypothetical protein